MLTVVLLDNPAVTLPGIYPIDLKTPPHGNLHVDVLAVLFIIIKNGIIQGILQDQWINSFCYTCAMEYYSEKKKSDKL